MFDCISTISNLEPPKFYSRDEVERHNREIDAWTIIHEKVYDITKFIAQHPVIT
jgi:cytochrome b involved in lipid metabolism